MTRKNVTVSVSEDIFLIMKRYDYINWSGVCRISIYATIKALLAKKSVVDALFRIEEQLEGDLNV